MKKYALVPFALIASLTLAGCAVSEDKPATVKEQVDSPVLTEESPTEDVVTEEVAEEEPEEEAPALGDLVEVGNWDVKVNNVELNANAIIAKANPFNDKPKDQYVLVTYEATYTGTERVGDTMMDLTWSLTTTDSQVNDQAYSVTPADNQSWPTEARKGGTVKQQVLFDLPKNMVKGGILTVETYDDNFDTVYADFTI